MSDSKKAVRDEEFDTLWDKGEPLEMEGTGKREHMTVFSMKIDRQLLRSITDLAKDAGVGPSTMARRLIEEALVARGENVPVENVIDLLANKCKEIVRQTKPARTQTKEKA